MNKEFIEKILQIRGYREANCALCEAPMCHPDGLNELK